jgi:hypothetical protein
MGNFNSVGVNQSVVDAKVKYWGDPNFQVTRGTLSGNEPICVLQTKPPGQVGFVNSAYYGGVAASDTSNHYVISAGAYKQQQNCISDKSKCKCDAPKYFVTSAVKSAPRNNLFGGTCK